MSHIKKRIRDKSITEWEASLGTNWELTLGKHYSSVVADQLRLSTKGNLSKGPKVLSSAYFQLKLGKGYYLPYLRNIGKRDDAICRMCGRGEESVKHILLICPRFRTKRVEAMLEMGCENPTLATFFQTKKGKVALFNFIKETNLGTKKWIEEGGTGMDEEVREEEVQVQLEEFGEMGAEEQALVEMWDGVRDLFLEE